jgi:phenylpropionate dioxygenase-like ring-hydroxylating dioxygenase large terminal subunit
MQNNWYAAAKSIDLKNKPLASKLLDEPIVLFRDSSGQAVALVDRCPHRNVKLSKGKVIDGNVQCPYHGWEFNNQGKCVNIPSLLQDEKIPPSACSSTYPIIEQQDIIWVWVGNRKPNEDEKPFSIPHFDEDGWNHNWVECTIKNTVDNVIENFIDCSHTGYIHGGLFRTPASHLAKTFVKRVSNGVVIDIDEKTDKRESILSKVLLGKNVNHTHQDQFILPSIVRVAYGFGGEKEIIGYQICVPVEDFVTKVYVCVTWKMGLLTNLISPIVKIMGNVVLNQDLWVLEDQGATIKKYGEHFVSTPADTANNWIRLARQNAKSGIDTFTEKERNVDFKL